MHSGTVGKNSLFANNHIQIYGFTQRLYFFGIRVVTLIFIIYQIVPSQVQLGFSGILWCGCRLQQTEHPSLSKPIGEPAVASKNTKKCLFCPFWATNMAVQPDLPAPSVKDSFQGWVSPNDSDFQVIMQ